MLIPRNVIAILPQLVSTIMIPLTVAGIGWYYTRWQQGLNDLRTMVDMVTDASPEKRKYGIAMFEYLLKNDKVPVEFVTAQLNYANSSSDKDLLPLMEAAIRNAALENSSVLESYQTSTQRLPSGIFVHTLEDAQRPCIAILVDQMKDTETAGLTVPSIVPVKWAGDVNELRYFKPADARRAETLVTEFGTLGLTLKPVDLSKTWSGSRDYRPNTFEIWFGKPALPAACSSSQPG